MKLNQFNFLVWLIATFGYFLQIGNGLLFPQDSETREIKSLDGLWDFRLSPKSNPDVGFEEAWYANGIRSNLGDPEEVLSMPVPSSFNDITTNASVRDFVGWAWYQKEFFVPTRWESEQVDVRIRFGSAHYTAIVWVNGQLVGNHSGGHLPFEFNVTGCLDYTGLNTVTVALNNTLNPYSIPQGQYIWHNDSKMYPPGYSELTYDFDFFNYGGIHRPVNLYVLPKNLRIEDITVKTDLTSDLSLGSVHVSVDYFIGEENEDDLQCVIELYEQGRDGAKVGELNACDGVIDVKDPKPWWPYLMTEEKPGYLYMLHAKLFHVKYGKDFYRLPIGIRTVSWTNTTFQINYKDFYFRGFGKHEDSDFRGKGLDLPLVARDFQLIKWIGANSFRTSHYPYAEEIMDFADREGIVVIDETPAVALSGFGPQLLANHLKVTEELIARDKNRPCVALWSLANEPKSNNPAAKDYFQKVADHARHLDSTRPVGAVLSQNVEEDQAPEALDIIGVNRYFSWYSDTGHIELITYQMTNEIKAWKSKYNKPLIITEYGADTVAGMHSLPSYVFSEEYQCELIENTVASFHNGTDGIIGEMIWNFADFMTKQTITRVIGNKKGVFTRQREPKASAHWLRRRYFELAGADRDKNFG